MSFAFDDATTEDKPAFILDNGSGMIKAGSGADEHGNCADQVKYQFASMVGVPREDMKATDLGNVPDGGWVGDDAQTNRALAVLRYPIEHGVINDWDAMERIWDYLFEQKERDLVLGGDEADFKGVLLTEAPRNPQEIRKKCCEYFFEKRQVHRFKMEKQGVCTIYSAGKTTGTVIDSGAGVTHVVPVYEGFIMEHAISKMNLAGRDLTKEWCKMLQEAPDADGIDFTESSALQDIAMVFKEKNCRVAAMGTFADECKNFTDPQVLTMPDGKEITVGNQIIRCPEIMFNTSMIGKAEMGGGGIHHMVLKAIRDCSPDVHSTLTQNLVLSGGNTLFPGFEDRIAAEVTAAGDGVEAKVFAAPERAISVFIGGAILASLETMEWQYAKDNLNTDPARQGYESIGATGIEAAMM